MYIASEFTLILFRVESNLCLGLDANMYRLSFAISLQNTSDLLKTLEKEFMLSATELTRSDKLLKSGLPPLVKTEIISYLFGISHSLLISMSRYTEHYYRRYSIPKSTQGQRQIEAPKRFLKLIQRWIYDHILSTIVISSSAHGFVPKRDIFTNAKLHLASKNIMVVDIKNFFPSIKRNQVTKVYRELGFPTKVAVRLSGLCTLDGRLPQGAPTSPALANIIFSPTDIELINFSKEQGDIYTRYADDLIFSGDRLFTKADILRITKIVNQSGFEVNSDKTRIIGSGARQIVTGLILNKKGQPPRKKRMAWRATFHQASLNPEKYVVDGLKLMGIASFVNQYNPSLASKYKQIAQIAVDMDSKS